ncbi:MAG TPA: biotin carboxylase N-terminal domain-containing protein [Trebonia sp.]|nr:biotin carboxylase N-terminal domain-containing protein [Trebonia sp.]
MSGRRVLRRVLVANRGEIAVRVIRTCRRLGIETVLTVSDADAGSLPARLADKVIRVGPAPASASYLDVDAVAGAAAAAGADAVHPGYGFLSENARLARACAAAGIVFIGPDPQTLEATGDKLAAREHAVAAGLPVLPGGHVAPDGDARRPGTQAPGSPGPDSPGPGTTGTTTSVGTQPPGSFRDAAGAHAEPAGEVADRIGYPVLVKAAGGGGGRGLRVVRDPAELAHAVAVASAEAAAAFGDPRVYLERYVERGRHVEVQLLGDGEHVVHLGDRDCSVQRRYQKLIEEAPAPGLGPGLRSRLREAAVVLGEHLRYKGAGTVEFLVDADRDEFYFLEVNARIQVEHPVTEAVTGIDLVAEQIAVAEGRPLRLKQDDVTFAGHAIEVRVNAEDPARGFLPGPGTVTRVVFPVGTYAEITGDVAARSARHLLPGPIADRGAGTRAGSGAGTRGAARAGTVRVDTYLQAGATVPPHYDSLLAKVIGYGADRDRALAVLRGALGRCAVDGVPTNLDLHRALLADPEFAAGGVDTGYLGRWLAGSSPGPGFRGSKAQRAPAGAAGSAAEPGTGAGGPRPADDERAEHAGPDAGQGHGDRDEEAASVRDDRDRGGGGDG